MRARCTHLVLRLCVALFACVIMYCTLRAGGLNAATNSVICVNHGAERFVWFGVEYGFQSAKQLR